jgi:tetratricopeptide (TPR) repeat protein
MRNRFMSGFVIWMGIVLISPVEAAKPSVPSPTPHILAVEDDEEEEDYEMPREVRESQAIAFYNKSIEHGNQGNHKLATHLLEMAVAMFPEFEEAHVNLANAYARDNRDELALKHLNTAIRLDSQDPLAYYAKARLIEKKGNLKEAISLAKRGLKSKKINKGWKIDGQILLGHLHDKNGNVDLAIQETRVALALGTKEALAYCYMATYYAQKMDDESFVWLRKAEKHDPEAKCVKDLKHAIGED